MKDKTPVLYSSPIFSRAVPFCIFAFFILSKELYSNLAGEIGLNAYLVAYVVQIALVTASLIVFQKQYTEIAWRDLLSVRHTMLSAVAAVAVFGVWVSFGQYLLVLGNAKPNDLSAIQPESLQFAFIAVRLAGAVVVVPIMEEIFWRSLVARYLVKDKFTDIPIGHFTIFSFACTSLLFGLEHTFVFSGIVAGCAYNLLLLRTKSLSQCILSHALTNLLLSVYVLYTGNWHFW